MPSPGETFLRAVDELSTARAAGDDLGVRQSAEKAWLAVVEATDYLLGSKHNIRVHADERAHAERRRSLRDLQYGDLERNYGHLSQTLHGDIFYLGEEVSREQMQSFFEEAAEYVERTTGTSDLIRAVSRAFRSS